MKKKFIFKLLLISTSVACINNANAIVSDSQIQSWMKTDGYIVVSDPVKLDTLNPIKSINAHSKFTLPLIFENLITINPQQELQPALAESWLISPDGKSVTINIKHGHKFSDNTEVTAKDVANSIFRLCGKSSQEFSQVRGLCGCEETAKGKLKQPSVTVTGKYSIQFNISSSPTTFLYQLSSPSTVITKISPDGLIGSGPYVIQNKQDDFLILGKNQFYTGNINIKNHGIVMIYANGHNIAGLINSNKIDGGLMYEISSLNDLNNSNYKVIRTNPNITNILVLNNQRFPFNQPEIRQALSAEIYNNFNTHCAAGSHKAYGIIPNGIGGSLTNMMPDSLLALSPSEIFNKFPQLKKDRISVTFHQLNDLKNNCESKQLIDSANKFNINIKYKYHKDYSDLLPLYINHNLDGFIDLYIFKNREAYNIFEFFSKNGENDAYLKQDEIDKMLKEAVSTPSSHGRFQIYRKIALYMQENNIVIPLYYMDHGNLMNKCLTGISDDFVFNPFSELPKISKQPLCKMNGANI